MSSKRPTTPTDDAAPPAPATTTSEHGPTDPEDDPPTKPRRRWLKVHVSPRIVADEQGLRLELTISNRGPVRLTGTIRARVRGRRLQLVEPTVDVSAQGGPTTLSYRISNSDGLSVGQRPRVSFATRAGHVLTVSGARVTVLAPTAVIGTLVVAAAVGPLPPPDPEPDPPTLHAIDLALPDTLDLEAVDGHDTAHPAGPAGDLTNGSRERRVTVLVDGVVIAAGSAPFPAQTDALAGAVQSAPRPVELFMTNVSLPPGTPLSDWCDRTSTGDVISGFLTEQPCHMILGLELVTTDPDAPRSTVGEYANG